MDELFWGQDHEDVNDWAEMIGLTMAAEVRDLNTNKLFKIAKLNLRGRAKEWFRRLQPATINWAKLRTLIVQKYGDIDADDIRMKLMPSNKNTRREFRNILDVSINYFKGAGYKTLSRKEDFWPY
jgi:hypothetical protein